MYDFFRTSLGLACLVALAASCHAQHPPVHRHPHYPVLDYDLTGLANVIGGTGQLFIDQERARIEREKANQAKIDTKRKTFEEMMYEKANTPTFTEEQEQVEMMILRRVMNHPLEAEVTSGKAQNILLPYLEKLIRTGVKGPPVSLDPAALKSINVTIGMEGHNIGLLRDGGLLDWPIALRGPAQKKLAPLFPKLVSSATKGDLDVALYAQVGKGVAVLQDELLKKFHKQDIDAGLYLDGKRFLESLESSLKMIRSPLSTKLLNNTYAATGRTVHELVNNMTAKGLAFAPATSGNEASYFALQSALVSYAAGAERNNGFRPTFDPFMQPLEKSFAK